MLTPLLATTGLPTGALSINGGRGWLGIDHLSLLVLTISSLLLGASLYSLVISAGTQTADQGTDRRTCTSTTSRTPCSRPVS